MTFKQWLLAIGGVVLVGLFVDVLFGINIMGTIILYTSVLFWLALGCVAVVIAKRKGVHQALRFAGVMLILGGIASGVLPTILAGLALLGLGVALQHFKRDPVTI
jgi:hypothetical protein